MSVHPRKVQDLMLAPVAVEIDQRLAKLRDRSSEEIAYELALELDRPTRKGVKLRSRMVADYAVRNVDLHGWRVAVTPDGTRLKLSGGSVTIDLGLSAAITAFIAGDGASAN